MRVTHQLETAEKLVTTWNGPPESGARTNWRRQRKVFVMTEKETNRGRTTYQLETAEGGTCQVTEI